MQNHKVGMMNKSIDKKHLNDWLLEAWGNHPIISEQQQENFKQCFHKAKTYSQAVKIDLLIEFIDRVKLLKQEIMATPDINKIELNMDAIKVIEFKQNMLAAIIGECNQEASQ
jgi:hypothetical protein